MKTNLLRIVSSLPINEVRIKLFFTIFVSDVQQIKHLLKVPETMIDIFNILLIEDEPEKWVPFFEFNDHGGKENELIKVETITSLAKGKRAIIRNHRFLDAVLIEFNFPDVSPDEVIKTLHWKRKNYPDLPAQKYRDYSDRGKEYPDTG